MIHDVVQRQLPLQNGDQCELTIDRIGYGGMGVARHSSGLVCLVPKTLPGEKIIATVYQTKRRHVMMKVQRWLVVSDLRQKPLCHYFFDCGGCHMQHVSYEQQCLLKWHNLQETMQRDPAIDVTIEPVVPANPSMHYRNKNFFHCLNGKMGFMDSATHTLVDVEACPCAPDATNALLKKIRDWMATKPMPYLLDCLIRESSVTHAMMVIAVVDQHGIVPDDFIKAFGQLVSPHAAYINYKPSAAKYSFGDRMQHISGPTYIDEAIGNIKLKLSPTSFVQIHPLQAHVMYQKAISLLNLQKHEHHLDFYAGSGALSMLISAHAKNVYAIEMNRQATLDAIDSAKNNGIDNVSFRTGKCERIAVKLSREGFRAACATINPPRTGCDPELIKQLQNLGIDRFVYISCSPPTFKRDTQLLLQQGYKLHALYPYDMFPQTYHLELVGYFSR